MKNECSYVRDVLPLYLEGMVSEATGEFVSEHLGSCPECRAELEKLKDGTGVEKLASESRGDLESEVLGVMRTIRKKVRKRICLVVAGIASVFIVGCVLLQLFPVYRIAELKQYGSSYYTNEEIAMAISIGSAADRREAQAVLRLADEAFNDTRHTEAENDEKYGLLARYATSTDSYGEDISFNTHSLELWSAHLGDEKGYIWVYYSSKTFKNSGDLACGSWNVPSLWIVEKSDSGEWVVVQIREHP